VLAHQAAAAMSMGTCWPWETAATLQSAWPHKAHGERRGAGHIVTAARLQLVFTWTNPQTTFKTFGHSVAFTFNASLT